MAIEIEGVDVARMEAEAGGHRVQRVPPTEKRGRVHTSTVTVAVIDPSSNGDAVFDLRSDSDFEIVFFSGTGAGGQHRNTHMNSVKCLHRPTGIVETRQSRVKAANIRGAKDAILARLDEAAWASACGETRA
jgi:peptide chain release factor 1